MTTSSGLMMMHPSAVRNDTTKVNGRTYTSTPGSPILVPDFDAQGLEANGWINMGYGGTTAQRPATGRFVGDTYQNTTLGYAQVWNGATWNHQTTGA